MPTQFASRQIPVPGGTGVKNMSGVVRFPGDVQSADCAIKSYAFDYTNSDHHINVIQVLASVVETPADRVQFQVICHYADQNFDDPYTGLVEVLIVANVV